MECGHEFVGVEAEAQNDNGRFAPFLLVVAVELGRILNLKNLEVDERLESIFIGGTGICYHVSDLVAGGSGALVNVLEYGVHKSMIFRAMYVVVAMVKLTIRCR